MLVSFYFGLSFERKSFLQARPDAFHRGFLVVNLGLVLVFLNVSVWLIFNNSSFEFLLFALLGDLTPVSFFPLIVNSLLLPT